MAGKSIEFTERLKQAIKNTGMKNKIFAQKAKIGYTTLMNYLVPKGIGRVPEWDQLVKISIASGYSIDWFLTGKNITPEAAFMCGWTPEIQEACRTVKRILESGDKKTADALRQNIEAFETSVKRLDENEKLREEKRIKTLNQSTGTD